MDPLPESRIGPPAARRERWLAGGEVPHLPNAEKELNSEPTVPSIARIYDYWLGGTANYPVDREAAEQAIAANPGIVADVRANRGFLARAVTHLAADRGIRQFLDIGSGLPTVRNTHEVAQSVAPESRVVYVDRDPAVAAHARALLATATAGTTAFVQSDLRDVDRVLAGAGAVLDLSQPVAVMLLIVLHLIPDSEEPRGVVADLMKRLAPGSYLVISHPASDIRPAAMAEMTRRVNARLTSASGTMRGRAAVTAFFDGMTLVPPGVVQPQQWRQDASFAEPDVTAWCGIGRTR